LAYYPRRLYSAKDVENELDRAIGVLEGNCRSLLAGEFKDWRLLEEYVTGKMAERRQAERSGMDALGIYRELIKADIAFGRGLERDAVALYEARESHLNEEQRARLEFLRRTLR
jgi:hypothetical protein